MKTHYRTWMIVAALLIAPAGGEVIYVDIDATGANDGTSCRRKAEEKQKKRCQEEF